MRCTIRVWAAGALLPFAALAAQAPVFTASSVLPANAAHPELLRPDMLVSIYGRRLGPAAGCVAPRMTHPEPAELCGVSVTVGGAKSGLLYVQDRQINLRAPPDASGEGPVAFVVTYQGRRSLPIPVPFGPQAAGVRIIGPAYVHMPIWIHVDLPGPQRARFRYPISIAPGEFGGHQFEVRQDGNKLSPLKPAHGIPLALDCPCARGVIGGCCVLDLPHEPKTCCRLPLHLLYRFDRPGVYEVRYLGHDGMDWRGLVLARSPWLRFEVLDYPAAQRAAWLEAARQSAPADPVELIADFLPSVLALPDRTALSILRAYQLHYDPRVREYSTNAIYTFYDNPPAQ